MIFTKKGEIAIAPVTASKVEIDPGAGFSRATSRTRVVTAKLIYSYQYEGKTYYQDVASVILRGDAPLQAWAKQIYETNEVTPRPFVLCPESAVIGFSE